MPSAATPDVDVVIPVRDGGRLLADAVDSVLQQSEVAVRVLVVDDGSRDGAPGRLNDHRVMVLRNRGRGIPDALNTGLAAATAPVVARQDADDLSLPGRFLAQLEHLEQNPEIGLVGTGYEVLIGGRVRGVVQTLPHRLLHENPVCAGSVAVRRSVLQQVKGFRSEFRYAQDYDCWLRCVEVAGISILPIIGYRYRITADQASIRSHVAQESYADLARASALARRRGLADPVAESAPPDGAAVDVEFTAWWAREFAALGAWRDSITCLRRLPRRRAARELIGLARYREPQVSWTA